MANKSTRRAVTMAVRRRKVGAMYLLGWTQPEIGRELKVSQSCVSLDLKFLQHDWLERARADFDTLKSRELARIDWLEREYQEAWERSKLEAVHTSTAKRKTGPVETTDVRVDKTGQVGDARYLAGIQWCIERRLDLFGISQGQGGGQTWKDIIRSWGMDPDELLGFLRTRRDMRLSAPPLPTVLENQPPAVDPAPGDDETAETAPGDDGQAPEAATDGVDDATAPGDGESAQQAPTQ